MNFIGDRSKRLQAKIKFHWDAVGRRHAWAVQQLRLAGYHNRPLAEVQKRYDELTREG